MTLDIGPVGGPRGRVSDTRVWTSVFLASLMIVIDDEEKEEGNEGGEDVWLVGRSVGRSEVYGVKDGKLLWCQTLPSISLGRRKELKCLLYSSTYPRYRTCK